MLSNCLARVSQTYASDSAGTESVIPATILLVDGNGTRLGTTARVLEEAGYSVVTGTSACQAYSLTRLFHPDLVLLDADLPDGAAPEIIRQIKLDPQLASIFTDITDRKRTEEELQEANKFSGEVQQISRLGGWKYDVARNLVTWTSEVCRIYGVAGDFDLNDVQRAISFYAPEDRATVSHAFGRAVQDGIPYDLEVRFTRLNGERLWVRTMGSPVAVDGKVVGVIGNILDITERKEAAEALRASEERYRAIVDAFDGVIYICSQDYKITFMDDELIRRRGREALGENCLKSPRSPPGRVRETGGSRPSIPTTGRDSPVSAPRPPPAGLAIAMSTAS